MNEVPDFTLFVRGIIGFKHSTPAENAAVAADASGVRIVVDDEASQSAADFVDLPFDCRPQDPIGGVVVVSLSVGELEDRLGGLLDLPNVHFVVAGHGLLPGGVGGVLIRRISRGCDLAVHPHPRIKSGAGCSPLPSRVVCTTSSAVFSV